MVLSNFQGGHCLRVLLSSTVRLKPSSLNISWWTILWSVMGPSGLFSSRLSIIYCLASPGFGRFLHCYSCVSIFESVLLFLVLSRPFRCLELRPCECSRFHCQRPFSHAHSSCPFRQLFRRERLPQLNPWCRTHESKSV